MGDNFSIRYDIMEALSATRVLELLQTGASHLIGKAWAFAHLQPPRLAHMSVVCQAGRSEGSGALS